MSNPHAYTFQVRSIIEDGEVTFEARVAEFPHVVTYGDTGEEAYSTAVSVVDDLLTLSTELGRSPPPPQRQERSDHSGRVTLRLPRWLHRKADEEAQRERISLNQYLVAKIAYEVGASSASQQPRVQRVADVFTHWRILAGAHHSATLPGNVQAAFVSTEAAVGTESKRMVEGRDARLRAIDHEVISGFHLRSTHAKSAGSTPRPSDSVTDAEVA